MSLLQELIGGASDAERAWLARDGAAERLRPPWEPAGATLEGRDGGAGAEDRKSGG